MQLLTDVLVGTATTAAGDSSDGFDLWKTLGIPGAVLALATFVTSYLIGVIRPLSLKKPRYWHVNGMTRYSCIVRNRSFVNERTLTGLSLVKAPGWLKRTFWPFWKRNPQTVELFLWDVPDKLRLPKRNEEPIEGAIRKGNSDGRFDPARRMRVLAHAGSRSSRSKRLKKISG